MDILSTTMLLRQLEAQLRGQLNDTNDWTAVTFRAARSMFPSRGCTPHAKPRTKGDGWCAEYLADLSITADVVGAANDDPFGYQKLALALECEWTPTQYALKYDFCKLVDVRAARKIFVGYVRHHETAKSFVDAAFAFLKQHELVDVDEEYGVLLFRPEPTPLGWVITKQSKEPVAFD